MAHRNWSRLDKTWHPIAYLPGNLPVALMANEDQSRQWLVENPTSTSGAKDTVHERDEGGSLKFDKAGNPVTKSETLKPAFFAFVQFDDGNP